MHIRIRLLVMRILMEIIQLEAVVIGLTAIVLTAAMNRQARKLMHDIAISPGSPYEGNCTVVWIKQIEQGGWLLLHASQMSERVPHLMYSRRLPADLEITHFQPLEDERQFGRIKSLLKAVRHKGTWIVETVGDWMARAPADWKE